MLEKISREFIHGKKFDEQWKNLGLNDDDLKNLQKILLENLTACEFVTLILKFTKKFF